MLAAGVPTAKMPGRRYAKGHITIRVKTSAPSSYVDLEFRSTSRPTVRPTKPLHTPVSTVSAVVSPSASGELSSPEFDTQVDLKAMPATVEEELCPLLKRYEQHNKGNVSFQCAKCGSEAGVALGANGINSKCRSADCGHKATLPFPLLRDFFAAVGAPCPTCKAEMRLQRVGHQDWLHCMACGHDETLNSFDKRQGWTK